MAKVAQTEKGKYERFKVNNDDTLSLSSLREKFPHITGLRYRYKGVARAVQIRGDYFHLPLGVTWKDYVFYGVNKEIPKVKETPIKKYSSIAEYYELDPYEMIVMGITAKTTTQDFYNYFSKFGKLCFCHLRKDPKTGNAKGYGFIKFASFNDQYNCIINDLKMGDKKMFLRLPTQNLEEELYNRRILVSDITPSVTLIDLLEYFNVFGKVKEIFMPHGLNPYAFITFKSEEAVYNILKFGVSHRVFGGFVNVEKMQTKKETDEMHLRKALDAQKSEKRRTSIICAKVLKKPHPTKSIKIFESSDVNGNGIENQNGEKNSAIASQTIEGRKQIHSEIKNINIAETVPNFSQNNLQENTTEDASIQKRKSSKITSIQAEDTTDIDNLPSGTQNSEQKEQIKHNIIEPCESSAIEFNKSSEQSKILQINAAQQARSSNLKDVLINNSITKESSMIVSQNHFQEEQIEPKSQEITEIASIENNPIEHQNKVQYDIMQHHPYTKVSSFNITSKLDTGRRNKVNMQAYTQLKNTISQQTHSQAMNNIYSSSMVSVDNTMNTFSYGAAQPQPINPFTDWNYAPSNIPLGYPQNDWRCPPSVIQQFPPNWNSQSPIIPQHNQNSWYNHNVYQPPIICQNNFANDGNYVPQINQDNSWGSSSQNGIYHFPFNQDNLNVTNQRDTQQFAKESGGYRNQPQHDNSQARIHQSNATTSCDGISDKNDEEMLPFKRVSDATMRLLMTSDSKAEKKVLAKLLLDLMSDSDSKTEPKREQIQSKVTPIYQCSESPHNTNFSRQAHDVDMDYNY